MMMKPSPTDRELEALLSASAEAVRRMSPAELEAMRQMQAQGHARSCVTKPGDRQGYEIKVDWVDRCAWIAVETLKLLNYPGYGVREETGTSLAHQVWLLEQLRDRKVDGDTKACRWLGWAQAALVFKDLMTLDQQKELNLASGEVAPSPPAPTRDFQSRTQAWLNIIQEGDPTDLDERLARFLEEALELVQALGMKRHHAGQLVGYVFEREAGEPGQEVGGVTNTLAALCEYVSLDMMGCAERELRRVSKPEVIAKVRAKRAGRHLTAGPLPGATPGEPARRSHEPEDHPMLGGWTGG